MGPRKYILTAAATTLIIALTVYPPQTTEAQSASYLEGLQAVKILVEDLGEAAAKEQINRRMLEDQVLVILKSKAPQLSYDPSVIPYLYVNVSLLSSSVGYAANVSLELVRPVEILVGVHRHGETPRRRLPAVVSVWDSAFAMRGPPQGAAEHVRRVLDRLMEKFLADYFRANP